MNRKPKPKANIDRQVIERRSDTPELFQLSDLRDRLRSVLLGEPGSGKSAAFQREAEAAGIQSVTARQFVSGRRCPSPVLHANTKPTAAGPPDHLLQLPADAGTGAIAKTQLHLAIAQDGLDLRIALQTLGHPHQPVCDPVGACLLMIAEQQAALTVQPLPALDEDIST